MFNELLLLISGTFDIDVSNEKGWTALMFGARNGHSSVVKVLLDKGYVNFLKYLNVKLL